VSWHASCVLIILCTTIYKKMSGTCVHELSDGEYFSTESTSDYCCHFLVIIQDTFIVDVNCAI